MPSMVLMERTALACVQQIERRIKGKGKILVVCGSGNNGGDGFAIARLLHLKGYGVRAVFVGKESSRSEETCVQMEIAARYGVDIRTTLEKDEYSVIIDAVFGIGLARDIEGRYREVLESMNAMEGYKVAVDIPSGVHASTGRVMGIAFRADLTVTFAFEKLGCAFYPGSEYAGEICVEDIGIPPSALGGEMSAFTYERGDLPEILPPRRTDSNKGTYGRVLMIAGSKGMAGAAYLSARAAYAVGAGLVQIYTDEANRIVLQQLLPEAIITTYESYDRETVERLLGWADVVGIGPGIGTDRTAEQLLLAALRADVPCVVDADGLNLLAKSMDLLSGREQGTVLTPHMKEMSRLAGTEIGAIKEDRMAFLEAFMSQYPVTCVLKDARTVVAEKAHPFYVNKTGNSAMAKGGSGDVLCGMITGLLAQGQTPFEAAAAGVYLHGLSGDDAREKKGAYSVLASDILDAIGNVISKEMGENERNEDIQQGLRKSRPGCNRL